MLASLMWFAIYQRKLPQALLSNTFSLASLGNSVVAIGAGLISSQLTVRHRSGAARSFDHGSTRSMALIIEWHGRWTVQRLGLQAPFILSAILLSVAFIAIAGRFLPVALFFLQSELDTQQNDRHV